MPPSLTFSGLPFVRAWAEQWFRHTQAGSKTQTRVFAQAEGPAPHAGRGTYMKIKSLGGVNM